MIKKFFTYILYVIIGILFLAFLNILVSQNQSKQVNEYWGIRLGDEAEDVLFYKGKPNFAYKTRVEQFGGYEINPDGSRKSYEVEKKFKPYWQYLEGNIEYNIDFTDEKTVKMVQCFCKNNQCYSNSCPKVYGIGINSSYQDITKAFGEPTPEHFAKRYGLRFLKYPKYNIGFSLAENKVYAITYVDSVTPFF